MSIENRAESFHENEELNEQPFNEEEWKVIDDILNPIGESMKLKWLNEHAESNEDRKLIRGLMAEYNDLIQKPNTSDRRKEIAEEIIKITDK